MARPSENKGMHQRISPVNCRCAAGQTGPTHVPPTDTFTLQRNHQMQSNYDRHPEVNVRRLVFSDWGDYSEAAIKERERILNADLPGCWYINPISCVHSPGPSDEFFDEIARRQGAWCRMLKKHFGNGWRRMRKQTKTPYQRGVEFEGVLILNGEPALPEDIPEIRRVLGQLPRVTRRNRAFQLLKQRQLDELRILTDEEMKLRQNSARSAEGFAYFILPHATVESPCANSSFIEEANRRKREWHRAVSRLFPKPERRLVCDDVDDLRVLLPQGQFLMAGKREPILSIDSLAHG